MKRRVFLVMTLAFSIAAAAPEMAGRAAYEAFTLWRKFVAGLASDWDKAITQYRAKLTSEGASEEALRRAVESVEAYGEAELYDGVYATAPKIQGPTQ